MATTALRNQETTPRFEPPHQVYYQNMAQQYVNNASHIHHNTLNVVPSSKLLTMITNTSNQFQNNTYTSYIAPHNQ